MAYNPLALRPHVKNALLPLLANRNCWHFDCWILSDAGELYVKIETREGGRRLLVSHVYRVHWRTDGQPAMRYCDSVPAGALAVTLQDAGLAPIYPQLNAMHWNTLYPMAMRRPDAFRVSSIAFHYVTAPSLLPLDHTVQNYSPWQKTRDVPT